MVHEVWTDISVFSRSMDKNSTCEISIANVPSTHYDETFNNFDFLDLQSSNTLSFNMLYPAKYLYF